MGITRTVNITPSPVELAQLFAEMGNNDQATFFGEVWRIAKAWPGAGWCQQSLAIVEEMDSDGRQAIETIAAHLGSEA